MTANISKKRAVKAILCFGLLAAMLMNAVGCGMKAKAANLMYGVNANTVTAKTTDDVFIDSSADFAVKLFQKSVDKDNNSLISPLSVMLALSMTANGADNDTKAQMEKLLGGEIPLDTLNEYLYTYVKNLPSEEKSKFNIANSIWFRDSKSLSIEQTFLQKNCDYYNAAIYKSAFDRQTVKDINNWAAQNTDGMIDKILEEIQEDANMYLMNAVVFDSEWKTVYEEKDVLDGTFTALDGTKQTVSMMHSIESKYIKQSNAIGFIKPYKGGNYSFVALLPNEDVSLSDYIASMTGEGFVNAVKNAENTDVSAQIPKFSYKYDIKMNDALKELGMPNAFDSDLADFSKLGKSAKGNIYIGSVLHKTFISVDEKGTKAAAVTTVGVTYVSVPTYYPVNLDSPFVYAIIDNATNLPLFIGAVTEIAE